MARKPATNPRKSASQERSRLTVDALLEATARILVKEGYDRASTNKIAAVAGVSIGSLYQYFPGKEALVAAVIDRHKNEVMQVIRNALIKLGLSLQRQNRPQEAGDVYDQLLDHFPDSPHRLQALFEKGQTLVMRKQHADAGRMFKKVLDEGSDSRFAPHALNHLATLAMRDGDFDEADTLYGRAAGSASDEDLKAGAGYHRIRR